MQAEGCCASPVLSLGLTALFSVYPGLLRDITSALRKYLSWKEKDSDEHYGDEPAVFAACVRARYLSENLFALS